MLSPIVKTCYGQICHLLLLFHFLNVDLIGWWAVDISVQLGNAYNSVVAVIWGNAESLLGTKFLPSNGAKRVLSDLDSCLRGV